MNSLRKLFNNFSSVLAKSAVGAVWLYRLTLSPFLGGRCRFTPTCSEYAIQAFNENGFFKGAELTLKRLSRCHPWGSSGVDPVIPRRANHRERH
jgi:uncharacterized protein